MFWKKLIGSYGVVFLVSYLGGFIFLVTLYGKFKFPTFIGDILIEEAGVTLYFPFASSLAIAAFITVMFEIYRNFFKRYG